MTTKELIKMLQDADPTGEAHVRMSGGIPYLAEAKPGYWDGPYSYLDEDGNWVESSKGTKIDIWTMDIWDFVERQLDINEDAEFESIKEKIKFDLSGTKENNQKYRIDPLLKKAKEAFDEINRIQNRIYQRALDDMIENAKKGWTWFQDKKIDSDDPNMHFYYTWKIYDENGEVQGSCINNTESVQKSGLWERVDNGVNPGYYQWIFKN
jgi:hypothetical protein